MKIITTVGTSLLTNPPTTDDFGLSDEKYSDEVLKDTGFQNLVANFTRKANSEGRKSCAEIASIEKIDPSGQADIYLLCTETVLSRACGEALGNYFGERVKEVKVIEGLQVKNVKMFKDVGVVSLLNQLEKVAQNGVYWDDCVLNITGGYKAIIPMMTIIGQLKKLPTYYIFEESNVDKYELIEIPIMPIDYKTDVFEQYWEEFLKFGKDADEIVNRKEISDSFFNDCSGCFEAAGEDLVLNPVGKILWWNYRSEFFIFYSSERIYKELLSKNRLLDYFKQSFSQEALRDSNNVCEGTHKTVMKKFHDTLRIYWFSKNNEIYVYKIFEDHDAHEKFINSTQFTSDFESEIIQSSILNRIKTK